MKCVDADMVKLQTQYTIRLKNRHSYCTRCNGGKYQNLSLCVFIADNWYEINCDLYFFQPVNFICRIDFIVVYQYLFVENSLAIV